MQNEMNQRGVTLIELLVSMAILLVILGGIVGLLDSAHRMYLKTRYMDERQQTARTVMNYLTYRLREIDGGGTMSLGRDPRRCTDCHVPELDHVAWNSSISTTNDPNIPCTLDVLIPRRNVIYERLTTLSGAELPALTNVAAMYTNLGNNSITFWADLLPQYGISDTFTDSPVGNTNRNGKWDLSVDVGSAGYHANEPDREILYIDQNGNGSFDYYAEKWTLELRKSDKNYYDLIEKLSFGNFTSKNKSVYQEYTGAVAYGLTGLGINIVKRYRTEADFTNQLGASGIKSIQCAQTGCHTDYGSTSTFDYAHFNEKHPWWNIRGFSVEVAAAAAQGGTPIRIKQFVIPRNLEVNMR